jgi:hypothetical protein
MAGAVVAAGLEADSGLVWCCRKRHLWSRRHEHFFGSQIQDAPSRASRIEM